MEDQRNSIFRKKTLDRMASPEQLTDYLRVTSPGVWVILAAVIFLLAGLFAWSRVGTLETSADVKVVVEGRLAEIIPVGQEDIASGMPLRVSGRESVIISVEKDGYGRTIGRAEVDLPDGIYDGTVVTEVTHPIDFLTESR